MYGSFPEYLTYFLKIGSNFPLIKQHQILSPHHRPHDLHNHPLFLLISTRQKLFNFFDLHTTRLQMGKF